MIVSGDGDGGGGGFLVLDRERVDYSAVSGGGAVIGKRNRTSTTYDRTTITVKVRSIYVRR